MRSPPSVLSARIASSSYIVWGDRKRTTPIPSASFFERRTSRRPEPSDSLVRSSQAASATSLRLSRPSRISDAMAMSTSPRLLACSDVSSASHIGLSDASAPHRVLGRLRPSSPTPTAGQARHRRDRREALPGRSLCLLLVATQGARQPGQRPSDPLWKWGFPARLLGSRIPPG